MRKRILSLAIGGILLISGLLIFFSPSLLNFFFYKSEFNGGLFAPDIAQIFLLSGILSISGFLFLGLAFVQHDKIPGNTDKVIHKSVNPKILIFLGLIIGLVTYFMSIFGNVQNFSGLRIVIPFLYFLAGFLFIVGISGLFQKQNP